ncbi:hypothetical protein BGZ79_001119 [Entomortierella chlamydospora]|nr:hypothetical protein BGZ79_001119 [Entomortierella chlamydospora]
MTSNPTQITNSWVLISKIPEGVAPNKNHFQTITVTEAAPFSSKTRFFVKNLIFSLDPYDGAYSWGPV